MMPRYQVTVTTNTEQPKTETISAIHPRGAIGRAVARALWSRGAHADPVSTIAINLEVQP
jgi:hypothetical protein